MTDIALIQRPKNKERRIIQLVLVSGFLLTIWSWWYIDMSLTRVFGGLGDIQNLLAYMLPPDFGSFNSAIRLTFETLWMAVIGTFLSVILSIPIAFGAARNTSSNALLRGLCRGIIVLSRAIPDLIFAAVFVRSVGIGVLPGVLALAAHSIGMIGKLLADAIEQVEPGSVDATRATGATKRQVIVTSIIPQVMPSFISTVLYRLDINLRSSTVLGLVGAGGVGFLLKKHLGQLEYDLALGVVLIVFAFITAMEALSGLVRSTLLGKDFSMSRRSRRQSRAHNSGAIYSLANTLNRRNQNAVSVPWTPERIKKFAYGGVFVFLVAISFYFVNLGPTELLYSLDDLWRATMLLLPPDFTTARSGIINGMVESIAVAFVSTALGAIVSLPLGLLAARNIVVHKWVSVVSRLLMLALRGTPELIIAVIFVAAMGLGPVPGTFALVVGTAGFFGKLIADALEEINPIPREAVFATGASRLQEIATSVLPQASPALVSSLLYVLDINLRVSAVLGIVGGGGIGFLLFNSLRVLQFETTGAIIVSIFVVVYAIELLASYIRKIVL